MTRDQAESRLQFLGFIIFENKLKEATFEVIEELNEAGIRQVMCTGDNVLTAISVARECSLIDRSAHCYIPHFEEGQSSNCFALRVLADIRHRQSPESQSEAQMAKRGQLLLRA